MNHIHYILWLHYTISFVPPKTASSDGTFVRQVRFVLLLYFALMVANFYQNLK